MVARCVRWVDGSRLPKVGPASENGPFVTVARARGSASGLPVRLVPASDTAFMSFTLLVGGFTADRV